MNEESVYSCCTAVCGFLEIQTEVSFQTHRVVYTKYVQLFTGQSYLNKVV